MENFKSKKIKVYDVIIEVEVDYTQSDEYREKVKNLTYEYQNCFLEDEKRKKFNKLLEYSNAMNKKEKVELTLYTEAYDHNVTLNGKITNKETAEITREFMKSELMEQVTVTKEEVILKVDGVGVFKWKIKKGEKGTLCEKWEFTKKVREKDKNGKIVEYEEKLPKPYSSYFMLFNAEQIEGIPPQEEKEKKSLDEVINQLKANSICNITKINRQEAEYNDKLDNLFMPDDIFFLNKESYAETLIHEMCHATGSLNRSGRHQSINNLLQEELIVEIATVFFKSDLGVDFKGDHISHFSYYDGFKKILETDHHDFFRMCAEAEKVADMVYKSYEGINEKKKEIEAIKPPFENFNVVFFSSEYNFNLEPKTKLTGIEAYEFLEKILDLDNKSKDKYKTTISVGYGEELHKFNLTLGNCEFSMSNTVSEALEYRLNFYRDKMQEYINKTGKTEFLDRFNKQLKIDGNIIKNIKSEEKEYVLYKRKINKIKLENKPKVEKKPLRRRNSRSRSR